MMQKSHHTSAYGHVGQVLVMITVGTIFFTQKNTADQSYRYNGRHCDKNPQVPWPWESGSLRKRRSVF
jgi:hypothetical protein